MAIYDIYLGTFYVFYLDKENLYIKKKIIYIYIYIYIHIHIHFLHGHCPLKVESFEMQNHYCLR